MSTTEKRRWSRPSSGKVVLVAAVAVMVPFAILALVTVQLSTDAVRQQAVLRLDIAAQAGAVEVGQELEGLSLLAGSYAQRPTLIQAMEGGSAAAFDPQAIRPHLDQLLVARAGIATAFVTDKDGTLVDVVPDTPELLGQNFAYRDWYQGVVETAKPYVSTVYRTAVRGHDLVVAAASAVPIRANTSTILGYLVVAYSTSTVQSFVDQFAAVQGVSISVFDQSGAVVAASGAQPTEDVSRRDDPAVVAGLAGGAGHSESGTGQDTKMVAHAPVPSLDWVIIAEIPIDEALSETNHVRQVVRITAAFLVGAILIGLMVLLRTLRRRDRAEAQLVVHQRALQEQDRRLNLALRAGELHTWEWDIATATLRSRTPEGEDQAEAPERSPLDAVLEPDRARLRLAFADAADGEDEDDVDIEYRRLTASGATRWIAAQGRVERDEAGRPVRVIGVSRDVTERHASDDLLRESRDNADRANQAKNEFLSRMSHELRTPLNAVLGFSSLLEMEDLSPDQREYVNWIRSGGQHLLDLINDVLDIARIESGDLNLSIESIDVHDVVAHSLELIRPQADQNNISLRMRPGGDNIRVCADRQRLTQVLLNLLSNAVKYNRPGGTIELSSESSGGTVSIAVTDTGIGISPEGVAKLFTPFERLGAESTGIEGTGVGLALSRVLSHQMDGTLTVASTLGTGSTFVLELPAGDPIDDEQPAEAAARLDTHGPDRGDAPARVKVLAFEDNVANIELIERALARLDGVELVTAIQGGIGLDLAGQDPPDLILLDVHLPDLPGAEVLRRLRADPATATTPIVVCSADASPYQIRTFIEQGAAAYLTKPMDLQELLAIVERVRRGQTVTPASPGLVD